MARKKLTEYQIKEFLLKNLSLGNKWVRSASSQKIEKFNGRGVVKADELIAKRKENGLVKINCTYEEAKKFIKEHKAQIKISSTQGIVKRWLVEPFYPHENEYYVAFLSERESVKILFCENGGSDVETEEGIEEIVVPFGTNPAFSFNEEINEFLKEVYDLFISCGFTFLEFNPFTLIEGKIIILDAKGSVDSLHPTWKNTSFASSFGEAWHPLEKKIQELDLQSGASMKLRMLNPKGRLWNLFSGGGASIILMDALVQAGLGDEIAVYGEYGGNPTTQETYEYTKVILETLLESSSKPKVLLIAGAIANFTDVQKTFLGIVKAIAELTPRLKEHKLKIFIRRGGPGYLEGIKLFEEAKLPFPIVVISPEESLTKVIPLIKEALS